jgi:CrcB protein
MKKTYLAVAIGGMIGACIREWLELSIPTLSSFPLGTWIINSTGSFLLAFLSSYTTRIVRFPSWVRIGIGTGVLGAYTTFSTFCVETDKLLQQGHMITALIYLVGSLIAGIIFALLGHYIAQFMPIGKESSVRS